MEDTQTNIIEELECVLADKTISDRAEILRRVTDLFVVASSRKLSDEQVALFDDVMGQLLEKIDNSVRAAFGRRLAVVHGPPPGLFVSLRWMMRLMSLVLFSPIVIRLMILR